MGTEIIIPGTPLDQIPVYDRPNFDPRAQNGYTQGSITSPPPGSSVEHYVLAGTAGALPLVPVGPHNVSNVATAPHGAFTSFLTLLGAVFGAPPWGRYTLVLQDRTAVTTTDLSVCLHSAAPTSDIDLSKLTALAGGLVVVGNLQTGGIYNGDTVDHSIAIAAFADSETNPFSWYRVGIAMPAGTLLSPADVLRIRYATASFGLSGGDAAVQSPDECDLEYFLGTPAVSLAQPPAARFAMRGAKLDGWQAFGKIYPLDPVGGVTGPRLYSLEQTRDLLGTDFNPSGNSYAPFFVIGLWIKNESDLSLPTITPSYSLQIDIYRGANQ